MPTIKRFGRLRVAMYFADHPPPHFHVEGADARAVVEIAGLRVLAGHLRRADMVPVLRWAAANREFLMRTWDELHETV